MYLKQEIDIVSRLKKEANNHSSMLMNAYISGSHMYGWNSKDSDIDIRGCFVLKKERMLGLSRPKEVIEIKGMENIDISLFELNKVVNLALAGNCNILEEINAEQLYKTAEFLRLKQLINNAFGKKGIYNSYKGMATFNYKKFILQGKNTVKKYLYVFRGLMAGIYVLQTGQIKANIEELNKYFKIPEVKRLLEIKKEGMEKEPLKDIEQSKLDDIIIDLFKKLDDAYLKSKIPEKPTEKVIEELNKFIIHLRLDMK